jgi:pimeloyl-ACP methyl ester carboxylesterase
VTARLHAYRGADGNRLVASVFEGEGVAGGPRRPVLLLHGGGQTRHAFDGPARRLAKAGFTGITVDQRGHGDSEWSAPGDYAFSDYGRDVVAIAHAIRAETGWAPVAAGASMGGIASLLASGDEPSALAGLILIDVTPRLDPAGVDKVQGFMRAHAVAGFGSIEEAADAVATYLPHRPRPRSLSGLRKNLRQDPDGRWRWHWDPRFLDGPRPVSAGSATVERALLDAAARLAGPALLVRGGQSELVSREHADEFLSLAPHAEFVDIADARHMVAGDRNDVFGDAIVGFMRRHFGEPADPAAAGHHVA